jgi:hypothetical protein
MTLSKLHRHLEHPSEAANSQYFFTSSERYRLTQSGVFAKTIMLTELEKI